MSQPLTNLGLIGDFDICDKDIIAGLNFDFQMLDNLVQLSFNSILGALPGSPNEGDKYILTTDDSINLWNGSAWITYPAQEGYIGFNKDDSRLYLYDGTDWIQLPIGVLPVSSVSNVGAGAEVYKEVISGDVRLRTITGSANVTITENTNEINIEANFSVIGNLLFPVGKIDMTLESTIAPNTLSWLALNTDRTLLRAGTYASLFAFLDDNGLIVAEGAANWQDFLGYKPTASPTEFVLRSFNALSPRAIGSNVIKTRTKVGPLEGTFQEDQVQTHGHEINTWGLSNNASWANNGIWMAGQAWNGGSTKNLTIDTSNTIAGRSGLETRGNSFGVTYWIRF